VALASAAAGRIVAFSFIALAVFTDFQSLKFFT
jgi:hypothetical protein